MKVLGLIAATAMAGLAVAACSSEYSVGTATVTAAPVNIPSDQAVAQLTTERCNRELSCDNIGPERLWEDMASCRRDVRHATRDYLNAESCTGGVDPYGLASCVDAIRNSRCGDEGTGVPRLVECRAVKLCR